MESTTLFDQRVYAQDTAPNDLRDGILWVDTSNEPPTTKVFSIDSDTWEPTAPGNTTISDNAPAGKNEGHIWVDISTTPPTPKVLDSGDNWQQITPDNTGTSNGFATAETAYFDTGTTYQLGLHVTTIYCNTSTGNLQVRDLDGSFIADVNDSTNETINQYVHEVEITNAPSGGGWSIEYKYPIGHNHNVP